MSFPYDDTAWATAADFLRARLAPNDRLLAPDPFRWIFPRAHRFVTLRGAAPREFDWVVVHKGELQDIPRAFLSALRDAMVPVFANEVFVVWAASPPAGLPDLSDADHVRAFHAGLEALPPEAPQAASPVASAGVTSVRLPTAPPAAPSAAVPSQPAEDPAPFPHDDVAWATTAAFLRGRLTPNDRLLAPDPFRWIFPRAHRFGTLRSAAPREFDWVVVHKGELGEVPRAFLGALPTTMAPVFANEVFVVWAASPPAGLPDLSDTDHVRAFHAGVEALPPEAAPPATATVGAARQPGTSAPPEAASAAAPSEPTEELAPFPHDDAAWASTAAFLRGRLTPNDRLLAPDPFRWIFPRAERFPQLRGAAPREFNWVVVHKGELGEVPRAFLRGLPTAMAPVFANEVFVVWGASPPAGLPDLSDTDHVRAFHAGLEALPPEAPQTAATAAVQQPGPAPASQAASAPSISHPVQPAPRPVREASENPARNWLGSGAVPGAAREHAFQEELDRLVADYLGPAAGQAVLDIGCGSGRLAPLLDQASRVVGIDIAAPMLERARARHTAVPGFSFAEMDAAKLDFADATFDIAVMLDVMEVLADPAAALAEAARVLSRGGRMMVTAMNRESLPFRAMRRLGQPLPGRAFSVQEMTGMLRAVGLSVVRMDGIMFSPGWAMPGMEGPMAALEEDPEFIEAARLLGRRAGAEYALGFAMMARKA